MRSSKIPLNKQSKKRSKNENIFKKMKEVVIFKSIEVEVEGIEETTEETPEEITEEVSKDKKEVASREVDNNRILDCDLFESFVKEHIDI